MKKFFNILLKILGILSVLVLVVVVLSISSASQKIPDLVVASSTEEITALRGNYSWNSFSAVLKEENHTNSDYVYTTANSIIVSPNEKITLKNPIAVGAKHYFDKSYFIIEDFNGVSQNAQGETITDSIKGISYIEFNVPQNEGAYIYYISVDYFEKGYVEYSFKVVVSQEPTYNILDLLKYKDTSLLDSESIREILNVLPYSRNISNITIKSNEEKEIDIKFNEIVASRTNYSNNAIALLTLIPELKNVKFYSDSDYYIFSRAELESLQGRSLVEYVDNPELWEKETIYKEKNYDFENTKDIAIFNIIKEILNLSSGDKFYMLTVDTKSFQDNTDFEISDIVREKILEDLQEYANTLYDISLGEYLESNYTHPYVGAELIIAPSGDIIENNLEIASGDEVENVQEYTLNIVVLKNKSEDHYIYKVGYVNGLWVIGKHNEE